MLADKNKAMGVIATTNIVTILLETLWQKIRTMFPCEPAHAFSERGEKNR